MSAIVTADGLIHYEAIGRGKPLIFIHGWLGSWRYWVPTMEELSERYRTYAFDLWGFGDSHRLKGRYEVADYVALLQTFMDHLGIWTAPLVGHALGAVVAVLFAAQTPERVEQVMAVSLPLVGAAISRPLSAVSNSNDILSHVLGRRHNHYLEVELEAAKADAEAVSHSVRSVMGRDLRRELLPLDLPVLLVHGKNDPVVRPPVPEWLAGLDNNVRAMHFNGSHHFPMLEESSKFNRLLKDFLEAGDDLHSLELKEEWRRRMR